MLKYGFISVYVAVTYAEWKEKHFTKYQYDANLLYRTSYVYDPTNTKTETKGEISLYITSLES